MDAVRVAAYQVMPFGKRLAKGREAVAASVGQPVQLHHIIGRHLDTIGHVLLAVCIVAALMGFQAQITTGSIAQGNLARIFILHPNLAAQAAAIAQRFPLGIGHFGEGLF